MSKVLITGGSGFIGTNLIDRLVAEGHEVKSLDIKPPSVPGHRLLWQPLDILDKVGLTREFKAFQPDHLVHLAARTDMHGHSLAEYRPNVEGVGNVMEAASRVASLQRVVFASSRLVCRIGYQPRSDTDYQPTTPYGESKVLGEKLVRGARHLPFDWVIVRPTSVWGPWFHVPYRNFFDAVSKGRYLHPRGKRIRKSFGFVGNSVFQLQRLLEAPAASIHERTFYLADYEPIEVLGWGEMIRAAFEAPPIREVPMGAMRALARTGDGLARLGWKDVPITSFRLDNLLTDMLHDTTGLQAVCGPLPYSIDAGVPLTAAWMQAQGR